VIAFVFIGASSSGIVASVNSGGLNEGVVKKIDK
jgi:hypothetical protein